MSLDLALLPFEGGDERWAASFCVLEVPGGALYPLLSPREKRLGRRVPTYFGSHCSREVSASFPEGDTHYGNTQETPYGEPLLYLRVTDILSLADSHPVRDNAITRAAWAYLASLPAGWNVALFWH